LRIHCRELVDAPKSRPMAGSATLTIVESRNAIPDPTIATPRTQRPGLLL
jgi:hypothetical protein